MFQGRFALVLLGLFLVAMPVQARNVGVMLPIEPAITAPDAQQRLENSVKLYFATKPPHGILRTFGTYVAHRRSNGFAKSDKTACDWAFLAALRELQERALELGGNAVVNIESYYDRDAMPNRTQFECRSGFLMVNVVLRGEVVRMAGR